MKTALSDRRNGPFAVQPGQQLLGEIITWNCSGVAIQYAELIEALRSADLDERAARELAPRHAFSRACKKLQQARIIRQVAEDEDLITFQFTAESRAGDRFEYTLETMLYLNKATGNIHCDLPGLATLAQEELDRCQETRTGGDITKIIQRLFEREADLFPIREQGGAYFCPQMHASFIDKIQTFVGRINGRLNRYPVPAGTPQGDKSVKESVTAGIEALIAEHNTAIDSFGEDTRPSTLERAAERIQQTRHKVECYAVYLAEQKQRLEKDLAKASSRLRTRVDQLA